jgi:uncharacterized protein DUF4124
MRWFGILLLLVPMLATAQVYRWVDEKGRVHYSNWTPPAGVKATTVDIDAKPGPESPESTECYTVRCQGERLEQRLARQEQIEARLAAERAAAAPKPPRGLDFRKYVSIWRGISEGELLGIAGEPDLLARDAKFLKTYTYLPTSADPFTTTITLVKGRVSEIERVRKF